MKKVKINSILYYILSKKNLMLPSTRVHLALMWGFKDLAV